MVFIRSGSGPTRLVDVVRIPFSSALYTDLSMHKITTLVHNGRRFAAPVARWEHPGRLRTLRESTLEAHGRLPTGHVEGDVDVAI
jgi:hypothetical protein